MRKKRKEARLLSYSLLYDKSGKLITERTSTDIKELKKFFTSEEYQTLKTIIREATQQLDTVHNHIEACLNARIMNSK
jgi:CO dehydrogenase/acetyl-CoA synthase beta subunit